MADLVLPQLGETVTEGTITRWFKNPGDSISVGEMLYEVSTDKVDSEVPSPMEGVISEIRIPVGETVDVGTVLRLSSYRSASHRRLDAPRPNAQRCVPRTWPPAPRPMRPAHPPRLPPAPPANARRRARRTTTQSFALCPSSGALVRETAWTPRRSSEPGRRLPHRGSDPMCFNAIDETGNAPCLCGAQSAHVAGETRQANARQHRARRRCRHRSPPRPLLSGPTATRASNRSTTSAAARASTW